MNETSKRQIDFIKEVDKIKSIYRKTIIVDGSKYENDAEHSWHVALAAIVLKEYVDDKELNIEKVLKMSLIHDMIEIDAGDTFAYGNMEPSEKYKKEKQAAIRIFSILPEIQRDEFISLWEEFEQGISNDARYANALDGLLPILHAYYTKGLQWKRLGITSEKILSKNSKIEKVSKTLWECIKYIIEDSVEKDYLNN
jgi:putative hydrolase of HD superfamily